MAKLKPWYQVVFPREDLREGKPLDASEFAVHLEHVRDGTAKEVYTKPVPFFERTYLTKNLLETSAEVVRRLNGIEVETSAVFNMTTQFGGGKTHALTLLYHLAQGGAQAKDWPGVQRILDKAQVTSVPEAQVAIFVGTEFDSITGRGGETGEPVRKTPWGEIAWQIGGAEAFAVVAEHESQQIAPSTEVIRRFLPKDKPCLILMDEVLNYISRFRKMGLNAQFYDFVHNLSEEIRHFSNAALVVSIPASELEMNAEDQADFTRFKKLLDRLGKPVIMSAEAETAEIIRRRLFEWEGLSPDAERTISAYADWVQDNRTQVPGWFPVDNARDAFKASYPFHPMALSVFERKWQQLPKFQQTRGVLRMLALWVSRAYLEDHKGARRDPLIGLGGSTLHDSFFRTAVFEQLGEDRLEGAVTTDIAGSRGSIAQRLDKEAVESIRKARLHRKVAATILFESNGGMLKQTATVGEIRLAVGEPDLDIGNVEIVLETLTNSCYFLSVEGNRYRFGITPNLNKLLSDRRAGIRDKDIDDKVKAEIQKVFCKDSSAVDLKHFPTKSTDIPDRPVLTLAVLAPEYSMEQRKETLALVKSVTWESGKSGRTFKSAILWSVAESGHTLKEEARKVLAWQQIKDEELELKLDETQSAQLDKQLGRAKRDLNEAVWRAYNKLLLLGTDNEMRTFDLGLLNSSQAGSMLELVLDELRKAGDLEKNISPNFLIRKWPGQAEWSTKAVADAFYASPLFPRLQSVGTVKETIARGVSEGLLAYVGKTSAGHYNPFRFECSVFPEDIELSDDMFIISAEEARKHIEPPKLTTLAITPERISIQIGQSHQFSVQGYDQHGRPQSIGSVQWTTQGGQIDAQGKFTAGPDQGSVTITAEAAGLTGTATATIVSDQPDTPEGPDVSPKPTTRKLRWNGEVPIQKWMNFYTKVLAKFATGTDLKVKVTFEVTQGGTSATQKTEETKTALRELGMNETMEG